MISKIKSWLASIKARFLAIGNMRLKFFSACAIVLLVAVAMLAPSQLPVTTYKFSQVVLAAVVGYWLDRHLFPYAPPDFFLGPVGSGEGGGRAILPDLVPAFGAAMLRRAIIVAATMLAVALAL